MKQLENRGMEMWKTPRFPHLHTPGDSGKTSKEALH